MNINFGNKRGVASLEYGLIIGAAVLAAVAMVAGPRQQVAGMWHRTNTTVGVARASSTPAQSIPCDQSAHPNSKICAMASE